MKICKILLILSLPILTLASCQDYIPFWGEESTGTELPPPSEFFSFSTVKEVTLNVDYGKRGSRAPISVYIEDPSCIGEDGETYFHDDAPFKVFLDKNGRYNGTMTLPSDVSKVWVYSMRQGVPEMLEANVRNNAVNVIYDDNGRTAVEGVYPPGYSAEAAKTDKFPEIVSYRNLKYGKGKKEPQELKIWKALTNNNIATRDIYTITNWEGQRFARIIPTHYFDIETTENSTIVKRVDIDDDPSTYDNQGLIDDLSEVKGGDRKTFGTMDVDNIQKYMWNNKDQKPGSGLNNDFMARGLTTEAINTVIPYKYIDSKDGKTKDVEGAEIWLRFLGEGARYMDGLGYYYYPTGTTPDKNKLNVYVAIPNTSSTAANKHQQELARTKPFLTAERTLILDDKGDWETSFNYNTNKITDVYDGHDGSHPKRWWYHPKFVPFDVSQRVQLLYHYHDETGVQKDSVSQYFPPGLTIGFCLFYKEATEETTCEENTTMELNMGKTIYSNLEFNSYTDPRFVALNYNDVVVYGVEDAGDHSLEDVLFTIETNPEGITINEDRFTISSEMELTKTDHRTYCFEDIWPDGGDYDMNDVVIEHHHRMTVQRDFDGNSDNDPITSIEDVFTPVQPDNAADYHDAFGIQIPKNRLEGEVYTVYKGDAKVETLEEDLKAGKISEATGRKVGLDKENLDYENLGGIDYLEIDDGDNMTFILFKNVKVQQYETMTIIRKFEKNKDRDKTDPTRLTIGNTKLEQEGKNVLNPFIISQADKNIGYGRTEIHLPKHAPTGRADQTKTNTERDAYYIDKDGIYPFAISLPYSVVTNVWGSHFTEREGEGEKISKAYSKYIEWAKSGGEKSEDWYRTYDRQGEENLSTPGE